MSKKSLALLAHAGMLQLSPYIPIFYVKNIQISGILTKSSKFYILIGHVLILFNLDLDMRPLGCLGCHFLYVSLKNTKHTSHFRISMFNL